MDIEVSASGFINGEIDIDFIGDSGDEDNQMLENNLNESNVSTAEEDNEENTIPSLVKNKTDDKDIETTCINDELMKLKLNSSDFSQLGWKHNGNSDYSDVESVNGTDDFRLETTKSDMYSVSTTSTIAPEVIRSRVKRALQKKENEIIQKRSVVKGDANSIRRNRKENKDIIKECTSSSSVWG